MKLLVWNVRDLGSRSKKDAVMDLTSKHSPTILALVETKPPHLDLLLIRQVWGRKPSQWVSLAANGASGGIWVVRNTTGRTLTSSYIGDFSDTILLTSTSDGIPWKFSAIYGPNSSNNRERFWNELDLVASLSNPIQCLGGDFNVTRWAHERNSSSSSSQGMRDFLEFINQNELLDIPLQGCKFPFSLHWEELFPRSLAQAQPKPTSDHCLILLDTEAVKRGPRTFRFELLWLQEESLPSLIPAWWPSYSSLISGRAGFILQLELQLLKGSLKSWSKSIPRNFSLIKTSQLATIQSLDRLEEERPFTDTEFEFRKKTKLEYLSTLHKEQIY
ncbi:hypothetical protein AMTRI_Chr02g258770 [Amborella trichopoda]